MLVHVLYADRNIFTGEIEWYDHVADVTAHNTMTVSEALEYAFSRCQNIEGSWSMGLMFSEGETNEDYSAFVDVLKPLRRGVNGQELGHRSCMVGDRMIVDGKIYEVDYIGFKEVA